MEGGQEGHLPQGEREEEEVEDNEILYKIGRYQEHYQLLPNYKLQIILVESILNTLI